MGRGDRPGARATLKGHTGQVLERGLQPRRQDARLRGSDDKTVQVWDARHRPGTLTPSRGTRGQVTSVAFSPDGQTLASASGDKTVKVWDAADRPGLPHPQGAHGLGVERGLQPRRPDASPPAAGTRR